MYVIGTAGHVDHGKSALVQTLTGIDPDRLQEEKERGITIDLGFAWLTLPSGREVSIVDVPGHERFIKNMLAGVGGIDLALMVIAADEGVMPQTREHLAILDFLQVRSGVMAITKKDIVEDDWLELVVEETRELVKPTTLASAPIVVVSSVTGEGLSNLLTTLDSLLETTHPRRDIGRPRLPIDRVFTVAGFGTVVTGTLVEGHFSQGQEIAVVPGNIKSRIRGLQTHGRKIASATPGNRVAANLAGVATNELWRGQVVTTPGWLRPTSALDVKLRLITDLPKPLKHNASVSFYSSSCEASGKVRLLEKETLMPGEESWAQLRLEQLVAVVKGDHFILRSSHGTLGGGEIADAHAKRHRRFHAATLEGLATLGRGDPKAILLKTVQQDEPTDIESILKHSQLSMNEAMTATTALVTEKTILNLTAKELSLASVLISIEGWQDLKSRAINVTTNYYQQFPLRLAMNKEELKSRLKLPPKYASQIMQYLIRKEVMVDEGSGVRTPSHQIQLTPAQRAIVDDFLKALERNPYSPTAEDQPEQELLNLLTEQRRVVKLVENVVLSATVYDKMVDGVTKELKEKGKITVAQVRDLFGTSRKYALALMEHLDELKITRRVGDERILR